MKKTKKTPAKLEIKVIDPNGRVSESKTLPALLAESATDPHLMYQAVIGTLGNRRSQTASTKTRAEVSGTGKKPWRQKGTGRARVGSLRTPVWRKGGIVFGPNGRQYGYTLSKETRRNALIAGLKAKAHEGLLFVIDEFKLDTGKTKDAAKLIDETFQFKKPIIIRDTHDAMAVRSVRNLKHVSLMSADNVHVYDVLSHTECVLTKNGLSSLLKKLKGDS